MSDGLMYRLSCTTWSAHAGKRTLLLVILSFLRPPSVRAAAPAAPSNLRVEFVTRNEISLLWTAPIDAVRFKAELRKAGNSVCVYVEVNIT
jgi:hypothetical protein